MLSPSFPSIAYCRAGHALSKQPFLMHAAKSTELTRPVTAGLDAQLLPCKALPFPNSRGRSVRCIASRELKGHKVKLFRGAHHRRAWPPARVRESLGVRQCCLCDLRGPFAGRLTRASQDTASLAAAQRDFDMLKPLSVIRAKNGERVPLVSVFQVQHQFLPLCLQLHSSTATLHSSALTHPGHDAELREWACVSAALPDALC